MYFAVEVIASFAQSFIMINFLNAFLGFKSSNGKFGKSFIGISALLLVNILLPYIVSGNFVSTLAFFLILPIYCVVFLDGKPRFKILTSIGIFTCLVLINTSILNIANLILKNYNQVAYNSEHYSRIVCLIIAQLTLFIATRFFLLFKNKNKYHFSKKEWLFISIFFAVSFFIIFFMWEISTKISENYAQYFLFFTIGIAFLNVFLYLLLMRLNKEYIEKTDKDLLLQKSKSQTILIEEIKDRYQEIKTIRHDINNIFDSIATLAKSGGNTDLVVYIEKITSQKLNSVKSVAATGIVGIDAVINSKYQRCLNKNIEFECLITTRLSENLEVDLSFLLANLLDNAIEYSEKISAPSIILSIASKNSYLQINTRNKSDIPVLKNNPQLLTSKKR